MLGYFFGILSPFLDSLISYIDKFLLSKHDIHSKILAIYSGLFAFIISCIIAIFTGIKITDFRTAFLLFTSGFLGVLILLAYFKALTYDEASRVTSLFQFVPVMVIIFSHLLLDEDLVLKQYIGCLLIVVAGFIFSFTKNKTSVISINRAFWFMLLASFLSALVYILFKFGASEIGFWEAIPYEGLGNGISALFVIVLSRDYKSIIKEVRKISKKAFFYLSISELIYRLSQFSIYFALLLIPSSIASVLQGTQVIFLFVEGLILTLWFPHIIKEVIDKKNMMVKSVGIIVIILGLGLIFI